MKRLGVTTSLRLPRLDDGLRREVVQPEEDLDAEEREDGGRLFGARRTESARGRLPGARGLRGAGAHGLPDAGARGATGGGEPLLQSVAFRRRSALPMTETELRLIAALAIIGLSTMPSTGKSAPAAIGTPSRL